MPNGHAPGNDPSLSSELPFLVDTGDQRYYRVKGITLHLSDPKTGQVSRSVKLVHSLVAPRAAGLAGSSSTDGSGGSKEEPFSLQGDHTLGMSLDIEPGPCRPQNPNCPPMDGTVAPLDRPLKIEFVVREAT